ncbi:ribonuclease P protein component [Roseibacillus persicicus]|uniref:Ribonuclease P protein component n=1 Tax=Roseibacillus persicicus TaxID=454148 RepID=A0A918TM71_9BACT|nr:ribonuclease P protein component [Roseibacillus persicicus]MDQ8190783.1 ribonuclease P protein component [Roseibacillus persicicus]GHC53990.1 hypothetical protein GCM10007100_20370 [Roseibacillus persicicus]
MKLPRKLTLNDRADFQAVREKGKSVSGRFLVLAALPQPQLDHFRYALITSKKAGKAHERNHIRRLIRSVLVEQGERISPGYHLVFIARWRAKEATYQEISREVLSLVKKQKLLRAPIPNHEAQS